MKNFFFAMVLSVASFCANAATIEIEFTIQGNTWDQAYTVTNNSTDGIQIEQFVFDLRPLYANSVCFDDATVGTCHTSGGTNFTSASASQATDTGLVSAILEDATGGIDEYDLLSIVFGDFDPGETYSWFIDIDDQPDGTIYGSDLIGSIVYVLMSDGNVYSGELQALAGTTDGATFVISEVYSDDIGSVIDGTVSSPGNFAMFGVFMLGIVLVGRNASKRY